MHPIANHLVAATMSSIIAAITSLVTDSASQGPASPAAPVQGLLRGYAAEPDLDRFNRFVQASFQTASDAAAAEAGCSRP